MRARITHHIELIILYWLSSFFFEYKQISSEIKVYKIYNWKGVKFIFCGCQRAQKKKKSLQFPQNSHKSRTFTSKMIFAKGIKNLGVSIPNNRQHNHCPNLQKFSSSSIFNFGFQGGGGGGRRKSATALNIIQCRTIRYHRHLDVKWNVWVYFRPGGRNRNHEIPIYCVPRCRTVWETEATDTRGTSSYALRRHYQRRRLEILHFSQFLGEFSPRYRWLSSVPGRGK